MSTRLPINELPFENDTEVITFSVAFGEQDFVGTKRQYFDKLMADWYEKANAKKAIEEAENAVRQQINELIYPDGFDTPGTDKFQLPGGWIMEFERRINVRVDAAQIPSIKEAVEALPVDSDSGEMPSIDGCIKYKPDFSMSGYKSLRDDVKVLLNEALEFTPGMPGVKLVPPKAKAKAKDREQKAEPK